MRANHSKKELKKKDMVKVSARLARGSRQIFVKGQFQYLFAKKKRKRGFLDLRILLILQLRAFGSSYIYVEWLL